MIRRLVAAAVLMVCSLSSLLLAAGPAAALYEDDGAEPGEQLSVIGNLLLYVVAPLGVLLLIALLVAAPSIARGPRYRPGLSWFAEPVWFGGPADPEAAVARAVPTQEAGGASARW